MPVVTAASETEAAVSVSVLSGVGVSAAVEVESVGSVSGTIYRRVLEAVLDDRHSGHLTDHEALAALHNKFDLRDDPSVGDLMQWDGSAWREGTAESPYAGTWLDALFVRPTAVHVNDDEFSGTTKTGIEVTPTGTAVWTQELGRISARVQSQSSYDLAAYLHVLTPLSPPVTIETAIQAYPRNVSYLVYGMCFTNGISDSSNVLTGFYQNSTYDYPYSYFKYGTLTYSDSTLASSYLNEQPYPFMFEYQRLIWIAANTWKFLVSHDAVTWLDMFGAKSYTMSPTHFGVVASTYGGSTEQSVSFEYIRVTEADLS